MKYDRNIQALKEMLQSLGFDNGLEGGLRAHICFQPERFTLSSRIHKDPDVMDFVLCFEMHDSNGYACRHYDATLRKRSALDEKVVSDIHIPVLDKRMSLIDWNLPLHFSHSTREREEAIDSVITDLKKLDGSDEGKKVAELLRLKYWPGTAVESIISGTGSIKSKNEISQRFYFFDSRSQINVEEAYRYLCNRWLEKEISTRKKQTDAVTNDPGAGDDEETRNGRQGGKKGTKKK